jgi:response regulator NasT
MACNVLIVIRRPELVAQIRSVLQPRGYFIVDSCASGMQALRTAYSHPVDIAITGFILSDMSGLEFAADLQEKTDASVLVITPQDQVSYVKEESQNRDVVPLPRPVTSQALLNTLELMEHYRNRLLSARETANKLRNDLDRRALADQAKVTLMSHTAMSEAEAWRWLQKRSMDTGKSLRDVSIEVINQYKPLESD